MSGSLPSAPLPPWAAQVRALYESGSASQFIIYGNVQDRFLLPLPGQEGELADLMDFFRRVLMPGFDIVLSYDLGNGIRIEKGGDRFAQWPALKEHPDLPRAPRPAIEALTRFFRYSANLARLGRERTSIGCIVKTADLVAPAALGSTNYDVNALALLLRDWSSEAALTQHTLVSCLLTENLLDLHPLLAGNPRAAKVKVPLPTRADIVAALTLLAPRHQEAVAEFRGDLDGLAAQLTGATLNSVESLLKLNEYRKESLTGPDLVALKKQLVEDECQNLIEFVEPRRTLDDLHGQEKLKAWLRQDIALWRQNDLGAMPMGYLICGPVGTGKTYLVECLAGEAGVPVVKLKNFRDKWVGTTEGNLEKIFRLLGALNRCIVFIDEADQALGKRDSGGNDSGLSGRIYAMIAAEMSRPDNRGRIVWVLASSRPDLIEVDLKRPGRVDVKIPLFPTTTAEEGFALLAALCRRRGLEFGAGDFAAVAQVVPLLLTAGTAEALAVKTYRTVKTQAIPPLAALRACLESYQSPISREVMDFQIGLAVAEASDRDFVPAMFRV